MPAFQFGELVSGSWCILAHWDTKWKWDIDEKKKGFAVWVWEWGDWIWLKHTDGGWRLTGEQTGRMWSFLVKKVILTFSVTHQNTPHVSLRQTNMLFFFRNICRASLKPVLSIDVCDFLLHFVALLLHSFPIQCAIKLLKHFVRLVVIPWLKTLSWHQLSLVLCCYCLPPYRAALPRDILVFDCWTVTHFLSHLDLSCIKRSRLLLT